jgi:hypothetical protein
MRKRAIGPVGGVKMLFEMLDRRSVSDVVRGIAMLRGLTYRGDISSTSGLV